MSDEEKKPYEYQTILGPAIGNMIKSVTDSPMYKQTGFNKQGGYNIPGPGAKPMTFNMYSVGNAPTPKGAVPPSPTAIPTANSPVPTASGGGGIGGFLSDAADYWTNKLAPAGGYIPKGARPVVAPGTTTTPVGPEENPTLYAGQNVGPPVPTTGSRMPMPDKTRIPAIQGAQKAGHTFTNADIEQYYGKPGIGEDYRQLWARAGQNPNIFGSAKGTAMVTDTTPGGEGQQRFSLPGGTVPIQGARTKAELEDAKNIATAQKLMGVQSPGGVQTAIPGQGRANPEYDAFASRIQGRLNQITSELSGPLRKSKRAALTAEQGNLMNTISTMQGHQMNYEVGMGNLGINQAKTASDILQGQSTAAYQQAKTGAIPGEISKDKAIEDYYKAQTANEPTSPEQKHQFALAEKLAGAGVNTTEGIVKALIAERAASMSEEPVDQYVTRNLGPILKAMGQGGAIPAGNAGATRPAGAVGPGKRNKNTGETVWFDKDGNPLK